MALKSNMNDKEKSVMVIGGGMAGMTAAQTLSEYGMKVHLIEKSDHLGGHASSWACMATDTCQHCSSCLSSKTIHKIFPNENPYENLTTYLNTQVIKIDKNNQTFSARLHGDSEHIIEAGKIIVATGFTPTQPEGLLGQAYNRSDKIITTADLNQSLKNNTLKKYFPDTNTPKIGFIQCVGSRNREKGRDYCSQVCCKISLRHIKKLLHLYPEAKISLFYIDLQIIGKETRVKFESLSDRVDLVQGVPFEIFTHENGKLSVIKEDDRNGHRVAEHFDMMVLSMGIQASDSTFPLTGMLDIPLNQWRFIDDPDSLAQKDIYSAGCAAGPVDILTAKQQGILCAEQIIQSFNLQ
ncbi:MAG: FAD-dependent oxidoreductase, partial [Desulfobacula sp.]|nr:FAD-dependent oxidoreductase [Desulfobacula sp.]